MGITIFSKSLIEKAFKYKPDIKRVIELGSQNDYTTNEPMPPFANSIYEKYGARYGCIDLAGDNESYLQDLSKTIDVDYVYDLVTDFGTSEHVVKTEGLDITPFLNGYINSVYPKNEPSEDQIKEGYYNCWLNKHNLLKIGGLMINENPNTGSWPLHGFSYLGNMFYYKFQMIADYVIIDSGIEAAMGNTVDGFNQWAVLQKIGDGFPSFEEFNKLPIFRE